MLQDFTQEKSVFQLDNIVNVSSVPQRSPFRYPGGKTWLIPRIRKWIEHVTFTKGQLPDVFVEPFAGGAIVSLTILAESLAKKVIISEIDEDVFSVWATIFKDRNGSQWLCNNIVSFDLSYQNVKKIIESDTTNSRERAFKTIIRNRVNHGGILAPGAGMIKDGENGKGLKSRWYPETLAKRIREISIFKDRVDVLNVDGIDLMEKYGMFPNCAIFVDPPYTVKGNGKKAGKRLYKFNEVDHEKIFSISETAKSSILLTYDKVDEVEQLCKRHNLEFRAVPMNNTHHAKMNELIIGHSLSWL